MAALGTLTLRLDFSNSFLDVRSQRVGFVLLGAFLCSFLFIRTSARLMRSPKVPWWPGSVTTESGLHLHHLVWGIVLMMLSGFLSFITTQSSPRSEILAAAFGIGVGLTLDEFALWIYLRDVYWAEEGRKSFDAVVIATLIGGLVVLGIAPFDLPNNASSLSTLVVTVVVDVVLAALAILKGRRLLGLLGLFIPFVSLFAVCRLAMPESPWARRFYPADGPKLVKSRARFARLRRRENRIADAIAGAPDPSREGSAGAG
ncbi:MAG: hypothetical protein JOZ73_04265 [Solirubrobacterales bacterium]|nr:hypothetical protein [Solirubrobacterales bacterium]